MNEATLPRLCFTAVLFAVSMIPVTAAPIPITAPIQWTVGSGGNGHFYQLWKETNGNGGIAWTSANTIGGCLVPFAASIAGTGASEESFVNSTFDPLMPAGSGDAGGTCCPHSWIGLSRDWRQYDVFQ